MAWGSTGLVAFVHDDVVAATVVPNPNQRVLVLDVLCESHRVIRALDRVVIDFLNYVAWLQTGPSGCGIGLHFFAKFPRSFCAR